PARPARPPDRAVRRHRDVLPVRAGPVHGLPVGAVPAQVLGPRRAAQVVLRVPGAVLLPDALSPAVRSDLRPAAAEPPLDRPVDEGAEQRTSDEALCRLTGAGRSGT